MQHAAGTTMRTRAEPTHSARQVWADHQAMEARCTGSQQLVVSWSHLLSRPFHPRAHATTAHMQYGALAAACSTVPLASSVIRATIRFHACYTHAVHQGQPLLMLWYTLRSQLQLRHHLIPSPYSITTTWIPMAPATRRSYPSAEAVPYPGRTSVSLYQQKVRWNFIRQHGFLFQPVPSIRTCPYAPPTNT